MYYYDINTITNHIKNTGRYPIINGKYLEKFKYKLGLLSHTLLANYMFIEENGISKPVTFSPIFMEKYDITLKNFKSKINLVMLMDF